MKSAVSHLDDIGSIGIHEKQVAHDMAVAHAELGFAGAGENDRSIGQIQRINVADIIGKGELFQIAAVGIYFIYMVEIILVSAHRENDFSAIKRYLRIAYDTLFCLNDGAVFFRFNVQRPHGRISNETGLIDLPLLKHCFSIVMIGNVLCPLNIYDFGNLLSQVFQTD